MATIGKRFGYGGRNIQGGGSNGAPSLALVLRDIADDLVGVQGGAVPALTSSAPAALTSSQNATANANVQTGAYVQADVQSIATLANALKVSYNALQVDVAAIRTSLAAVQVDVAASRTAVNAAQGYTLKTIKGSGN